MSSSQLPEPDPADVRAALATLVAAEPELPSGTRDIEQRGRRRQARLQWGGAVAAALVVASASVGAVSLGGGSAIPVAQPPGSATSPVGDTGLAQGFPIGSAVDAVAAALPGGASVGELPMDIAWQPGGLLDVPVTTASGGGVVLVISVADGVCEARSVPIDALSPTDLDGIAASVCDEWVATGSLPVIVGGPAGEEQPDLAAQ